jgi:hypothetical protein
MSKKCSFSSDEAKTAVQFTHRIPSFLQPVLWVIGVWVLAGFFQTDALANTPGGIVTGVTTPVTLVDNSGTWTLSNGIVSLNITESRAFINSIQYTYTQNGSSQTNYVAPVGNGLDFGGYTGNANYVYNAANSTISSTYCDLALTSNCTGTTGIMEVHFSMRQGSSGFYCTAILIHSPTDG